MSYYIKTQSSIYCIIFEKILKTSSGMPTGVLVSGENAIRFSNY